MAGPTAEPVDVVLLPRALKMSAVLRPAAVVTGAVATASGPHPGSSKGVKRLGIPITDTVYVHVRVAAAFGIGVLIGAEDDGTGDGGSQPG